MHKRRHGGSGRGAAAEKTASGSANGGAEPEAYIPLEGE
ncbi:hypothetical protein IMSAG025_00532 [Muribaculaceae bacterium]|nr:hypothetical protein IMSAG025_00532 [Muribaculaceae bacterium]